ncbi:hypothetical protein RRG08_035483 [Elysia crispata]|uniref:Peptidase M20 dimerisation domain-containing protein n=1 Tax=Elysia crispata TaxID=231223 RepID=A0AAE1AQR2_9GAST|nr:hypothetical protein RRG08_035483 [Elysia crispata]
MENEKSKVCAAIEREDAALRDISINIWDHPELCYDEHHAHQVLTTYLQAKGFSVEGQFKLPTAFRATTQSKDFTDDAPTIGVMCEYDALPGIGHACGHNLIAILGLAIACGIKDVMDSGDLKGKMIVLGCPAEEGGGGKVKLIHTGAYEDMDIAMMAHPSQFNLPKPIYVANSPVTVNFKGKASHASSFPWNGINALDAAVLCYQSVACMRQQFRPTWRVHGIFTKAGVKPNIIPDEAELLFYCRAPNSKELTELQRKMVGLFEGAAVATGCKVNYCFDPLSYDSLMSSEKLASLYVANGEELGIKFENDPLLLGKQGGSTDMGNVSRVLPSIHPKYSLNTDISAHTKEFCDIASDEIDDSEDDRDYDNDLEDESDLLGDVPDRESDPAAVEIDQDPQDPYNAVTEVEFDDQADSDMDSDVDENGESQWVKNVNHFPPIPLFTGQPGIKAAIPDDPSPIDIYNLFITDELIAEWKTETNVMQEQSSTLKTCSCFQIEADSKNGSQ